MDKQSLIWTAMALPLWCFSTIFGILLLSSHYLKCSSTVTVTLLFWIISVFALPLVVNFLLLSSFIFAPGSGECWLCLDVLLNGCVAGGTLAIWALLYGLFWPGLPELLFAFFSARLRDHSAPPCFFKLQPSSYHRVLVPPHWPSRDTQPLFIATQYRLWDYCSFLLGWAPSWDGTVWRGIGVKL